MSRFKRPEPFGKAGLTVAICALVLATVGGAYAANNLSATASKSKAGKRGPRGPQGPAGLTGPAGTNGTNGKDGAPGAKGENGTNGTNGANGKSVIAAPESSGANCAEGGSSFEVEGSPTKHYACNGEKGAKGEPWTAGGTLPSGATETGGWSANPHEGEEITSSISFTIPLAHPLININACGQPSEPACQIHYILPSGEERDVSGAAQPGTEHPSTACLGSVSEPTAVAGNFCLYSWSLTLNAVLKNSGIKPSAEGFGGGIGVSPAGAVLILQGTGTPAAIGGTWAVTAP